MNASTYRTWLRLRDHAFSRLVRRSFAEFGSGSVIGLPVEFHGEQRIFVGERVYIGSSSYLQVIPNGASYDGRLRIESDVKIAGSCVLSACEDILICSGALLARNVYIADHSHRFDAPPIPIKDQGLDSVAPVRIGSGAWIGQNVVVMPGVEIGDGAVVGANSVVTTNVPSFTVAVGAPARPIRLIAYNGPRAPIKGIDRPPRG
jgi:acetyltransferase-like isoleucine patch superfamily enzyme